VLVIALSMAPAIIISTAAGVRSASKSQVNAARAFGATPLQLLTHVLLPAAIPSILTGILLAGTGWAFAENIVTTTQLTALWCTAFFVASAAASSAYLTVSEIFPVELRGMAIAIFYSIGTGAAGSSVASEWPCSAR
jgi:ABC-type phosphate transport system permease subunit